MSTAPFLLFSAALLFPSFSTAQPAAGFAQAQLSGWWAESYNTDQACDPQNLRVRHTISPEGRRLVIQFDRKWKTDLGEMDRIEATIMSSTERSLTIRYDGESRTKRNGQPVEWELSMVAPGVYRWRETEWPAGTVNTVVGIRCAN
ncbi:hypothetical protein KAK07_15785 [Ideonella sp. 4Y16]|uniref:hypothetical protein n=1 Tax=Ideonella alba TaxID=2824118 RepID=UPI001B3622C2|nr:hypothetical protein [Ideonella alba]MBQ0944801.1 hypothetical protein [Ideonella alba]